MRIILNIREVQVGRKQEIREQITIKRALFFLYIRNSGFFEAMKEFLS